MWSPFSLGFFQSCLKWGAMLNLCKPYSGRITCISSFKISWLIVAVILLGWGCLINWLARNDAFDQLPPCPQNPTMHSSSTSLENRCYKIASKLMFCSTASPLIGHLVLNSPGEWTEAQGYPVRNFPGQWNCRMETEPLKGLATLSCHAFILSLDKLRPMFISTCALNLPGNSTLTPLDKDNINMAFLFAPMNRAVAL